MLQAKFEPKKEMLDQLGMLPVKILEIENFISEQVVMIATILVIVEELVF